MSFFGKNIKKIRSLQNLSQQAFSELFDLKRATLGAYEEERSEPKIDTIIKIANHFSITIDDLLTNELTVNELLKFKANLTTEASSRSSKVFPEIACVTEDFMGSYPHSFNKADYIASLPKVQFPIAQKGVFRGFVVQNLEMTHLDRGFYPTDVVLGQKIALKDLKQMADGSLCIIITAEQVIFRRCFLAQGKINLKADHKNIADIVLPLDAIKELWQVTQVFCNRVPDFTDTTENKLTLIQQDVQKIRELLR